MGDRGKAWTSAMLRASHDDPFMGEGVHEHTWKVTVFWPVEPFRDLRAMRMALEQILAPWQGTVLPPELWAAEGIAKTILAVMGVIVGVRVDRPDIGGCEVWS